MSSKKAQLQSMAPAIIALVFAAIILVLGLVITQSIRDTDIVKTDTGASATIINESMIATTGLTHTLAAAAYPNGACGTITHVYNGSTGIPINTGNYSQSGCVVTNTTATYSATSAWLITYPYTRSGEIYNTANKSVTGLATFSDFWEIIVLAIVISIVIGLLLVVFGRSGRR